MLLRLAGGPALSSFRVDKLLTALRPVVPDLELLRADYEHLVACNRPPTDAERSALDALLTYGADPVREPPGPDVAVVLVVPRIGTVSPWSSKATDIARNCGLDFVDRIERGVRFALRGAKGAPNPEQLRSLLPHLHDRMTQSVLADASDAARLFERAAPRALGRVPLQERGEDALREADRDLGLALSDDEIAYLVEAFRTLQRDPTDVELMMFAQANSEHCRHKIFNATWTLDGEPQARSLFQMIRNTHEANPGDVLSAYKDNAAVTRGPVAERWLVDPDTGVYGARREPVHILMKVETHNHPTAISPAPGAGTGNGGEIRDEGATGRGGKPKAGLTGFSVSNLRIPGYLQPWEVDHGKPDRIASALDIMLEAPIGGAAYNNEFGRPNLTGYFRTLELEVDGPGGTEIRGYHKPIMIAGGVGNVRDGLVEKQPVLAGAPIVVLGGPAMLIGLGGGAASSVAQGASAEDLDFASVQRANPEIQRRCQEVLDRCQALGGSNPILSVHDVGAGGLSNAIPELVHDAGRGARLQLREIPNAEPGMSPMEIWCNEAQERYVLALHPERVERFRELCERERCPWAIVGTATEEEELVLDDALLEERPIDLPLQVIFGKPPRMHRDATSWTRVGQPVRTVDLAEAAERVLRLPSVAAKTFLITIGDRSVTGLVARDQLVGPWQVPVADVAVTTSDYQGYTGEAMAMGERAPLALLSGPAAGRMAIGEALTNLAAAPIAEIGQVVLSANWMAPAGHPGEDANLYATVRAVGMELCPALGIAIPVGKDSMSMRTVWDDQGERRAVVAPLSLVVSAFAPVTDARRTLTPELKPVGALLLVDLGAGRNRLGGSALAQVYDSVGDEAPDLDDPGLLKSFFAAVQALSAAGLVSAYHDRSDGGLFVTACELAFAGHVGLDIELDQLGTDPLASLFAEELGAVLQVVDEDAARAVLARHGLAAVTHTVGAPRADGRIRFLVGGAVVLEGTRAGWQQAWAETSYRMAALRDDPECAREEFELVGADDPGLQQVLTFDPAEVPHRAEVEVVGRPRVAILREQGVNGQMEMAAAFDRAGFEAVDVHMSDILSGRIDLTDFRGLAACGGFSYGDVLGAGGGWAKTVLFQPIAREAFSRFFARPDTFSLGVCNGCQMMAQLRELIPGAEAWPTFVRNRSEQFEARVCTLRIERSPSVLFRGMEGSRIPVAVAHGEGRALFPSGGLELVETQNLVSARYVDNHGAVTERYPLNPNGSPNGVTALTSRDGRATILMPHPERVFRTVANSWHPPGQGEDGPWLRLFRNARAWIG